MGMFDYVRCECPLPGTQVEDTDILSNLQTKDLQDWPSMDTYFITEDGQLEIETYRVEDHSDPNAEGLASIIGSMTRIPEGRKKVDFTGTVNFYGSNICASGPGTYTRKGQDVEDVDYVAVFVHGKLESLEQTRYEREPSMQMPRDFIRHVEVPKATEALLSESLVGKTLCVKYGGEVIAPFLVEVVAESDEEFVGKSDKFQVFSKRDIGHIVFASEQDAEDYSNARRAVWDKQKKQYEEHIQKKKEERFERNSTN